MFYYYLGIDFKIIIIDFGLVSVCKKGDDCLMKIICGMFEYIVLEVLVCKFYINLVDMWVLGVIVYILFSGIMLFEDDNCIWLYW